MWFEQLKANVVVAVVGIATFIALIPVTLFNCKFCEK